MKTLLSCLTATLLLATASPSRAVETFFKTSVGGTVQTQTILGPTDGRIRTTVLNEKRILQEYGVSGQDYELVFGTSSGLQLLPKRASAMLPTFQILSIGSSIEVVNTKAHLIKLEAAVTPGPASTTIFNNMAGELVATALYQGPFPPTTFKKLNFSVTARGFDPNPGGNSSSLLKFRIVAGGVFVQQP